MKDINASLRHICKAHKTNAQKPTLQKSLNARLLPATVFQFGNKTNHQQKILTTFLISIILTSTVIAQPKVPTPQFSRFQSVSTKQSRSKQGTNTTIPNDPIFGTNMPLGATAADIQNQVQQQALQQMNVLPFNNTNRQTQQQTLATLKQEEANNYYSKTQLQFQYYLQQLLQLNPNNFSITKAVYLTEAAYYDQPYSYESFLKAIQQRADFVKQILKQESMNIKNGYAVHYAIQKLFSQNIILQQKNNRQIQLKKIQYDFDDFLGDKDYTKMFVTKLLQTNSGQCHSMPLFYLCIAEQLQTKAWLSLAPQHSFIQFIDDKNNLSNFEPTNGHIVSTTWLLQSNAISTIALKNNTYLDTLSSQKLYAQCLADLQLAYLIKNGYDDFSGQINKTILTIDSNNINGLMYNNNITTLRFKQLQKQYNNPSKEQIEINPVLAKALNEMKEAQQRVNDLGYQDMPKEQYLQWLQSIEREKKKRQQNQQTSTKPTKFNTPK